MNNLCRKKLKRDIYDEELIRIDYLTNNYNEKVEGIYSKLVKMGYKPYIRKLYTIKYTIFNSDDYMFLDDEYYSSNKSRNEKVYIFDKENQEIVLTQYGIIIYTLGTAKHIREYDRIIKVLTDELLKYDTKLKSVLFEAGTKDYIYKISDVQKYYNELCLDKEMNEEYNIKRIRNYSPKEQTVENYTIQYKSDYYNEFNVCTKKLIDFSTSEYYNKCMGTVRTKIRTFYPNNSLNSLSKDNLVGMIEELKKEEFNTLLKSFKDEYIKKIF